jgi:hypothetical protein
MSKQRFGMTLEEHLECAKVVNEIHKNLMDLRSMCGEKFGFSRSECKYANATLKKFDTFRSEMDNAYHALIDNNTFNKYGHIYYGGNDNFKREAEKKEKKS